MPHSLYAAVKLISERAGIPWPEARKIYLEMQVDNASDGWLPGEEFNAESKQVGLPKSSGRAVWAAHPNLIAAYLIGLASRFSNVSPKFFVELYAWTTPHGEDGWGHVLRDYIAEALIDRKKAERIDKIIFETGTDKVAIHERTAKGLSAVRWFSTQGFARDAASKSKTLIRCNVVIDGELLKILQSTIEWTVSGSPMISSKVEET